MISKNLLKSSFIYTFIGALPLASAFFLLPFYTNYLTKSEYGLLALYISFTAFIQIVVNFGLDTYIGILYFENKDKNEKLKIHIGTIAAYLLVIGLIIVLVFTFTGEFLFKLIFKTEGMHFFPFGMMAIITAFFNSYFKTYTNLLINQKRPIRFFWLNSINFIFTIVISLVGLFLFPFSLVGPMWGRFLSGLVIFLVALYCFHKEFGLKLKLGAFVLNAFSFSFPVLLFFLLQWIVGNSYPYLLDHLMTSEDLAIFDFAVKCTLLVEFALNGLSSTIMPYVFDLIREKDLKGSTPELNKYFSSFTALTLLGIPLFTLLIPLVLPLFRIQNDYFEAFVFLSVLSIGFISRGLYNYFLAPIYYYKRTKVLPKIYLYTSILQIILSIIFIRIWGLWGLVWSTLLIKILQNIFLYLEAKRIFSFHFNRLKMVYLPILVIIIVSLSEYFFVGYSLFWKHITQLLFSTFLVLSVYRHEVFNLGTLFVKRLRTKSDKE